MTSGRITISSPGRAAGTSKRTGAANTFRCLVEGAGLSLAGNATALVSDPVLESIAENSGKAAVEAFKQNRRFTQTMTLSNLRNMTAIGQALGGSQVGDE